MSDRERQKDRLHVAIDCLVIAARPSGVERAVVGLAEGLAELQPPGQRFSLLVAEGRQQTLPERENMVRALAPRWAGTRLGRVVYEQCLTPYRLRSLGVDLLHGASYILPQGWHGPSVVTIHDAITLCHPEWCRWHNVIHYAIMMTRSAQSADAVIVPSEWTRREVVEHVGVEASRVTVAPLGVGRQFRPADEATIDAVCHRYGLPEHYVLCVGNIEPRKNLAAVVEAFDMIASELPHALVVVGKLGWKCREACAAMERSGHAERIRRLDWVPHEDLPTLYSGADLVVQWSLHEGFGLAPLEAMACGTAVVVSDGGALPEVSGGGAMVVALEAGRDGLATALRELLSDDRARAELATRGAAHVRRFTWRRHAQIVSEVYGRIGAR